jgi:hypothetical protein
VSGRPALRAGSVAAVLTVSGGALVGWSLTAVATYGRPMLAVLLPAFCGAVYGPVVATAAPRVCRLADRLTRCVVCVLISPALVLAALPVWIPVRAPDPRPTDADAARAVRRIVRVATDPGAWRELTDDLGPFLLTEHERYGSRTAAAVARAAHLGLVHRLRAAGPTLLCLAAGVLVAAVCGGVTPIAAVAFVVTVVTAPPAHAFR